MWRLNGDYIRRKEVHLKNNTLFIRKNDTLKKMNKKSWIIFGILAILCALSGFYHYRFLVGLGLGILVGLLLYYRNTTYWNDYLDNQETGKYAYTGHFIINYLLMAIALILCAKFTQHMNIFMCAIGMSLVKLSLIINEYI